MTAQVRFAPSPTGRLHIGNIRTALLNWLHARRLGGSFLLRIDDTDLERSTEAFVEGIREDLSWLGLDFDREERQSHRFARYHEIVERLQREGRLYACYETAEELDRRRRLRRLSGAPPTYDRAGLKLDEAARRKLESGGRRPHWRFLLGNWQGTPENIRPTLVSWHDLVRGDQTIDLGSLSDPVLVREDGGFLYTLASAIDDIDHAISHVIRGEDHVTNTAVQIDIIRSLGAVPPEFAHHTLLVGSDGEALSKRLGSLSIAGLRASGIEPAAITSLLAAIGTSDAVLPAQTLRPLIERFDLAKLSRAPVRFDEAELKALNARVLHEMSYSAATSRLESLKFAGVSEALWNAVRGNLAALAEVQDWALIVGGEISPVIEDQALCAAAASLLPPEDWNEATWSTWTASVREATGVKGRGLFHPLRLALTGRDSGPEMKALLPLIGRARALERLGGSRDQRSAGL